MQHLGWSWGRRLHNHLTSWQMEPSQSSLIWDIVVRALVLVSKISPFKPGVDAPPCCLPEGTGHTHRFLRRVPSVEMGCHRERELLLHLTWVQKALLCGTL